jgi:hypothetical protein
MVETIAERTRLKALAKVTTLGFDVADYRKELRESKGNGVLSTEQLELCLLSSQRELDIWNFILKLTNDYEEN